MVDTYKIDTSSKYFNESEDYLKYLLCENMILVNNGWWDKSWPKDAISIAVICNDVFAWGCADAENLLHSDLEVVARAHIKDAKWGIVAWCIKRRRCMPQKPVAEAMIKAGYDLDELVKGV